MEHWVFRRVVMWKDKEDIMIETNSAAAVDTSSSDRNKWEELRTVIQGRWSELTHEDLENLKNQVNRLVDVVQQRYGVSLEDAKRQVNEFEQTLEDKVASAYRSVSDQVGSRYRSAREGVNEFASDVRNFGFGTTVVDLARHYPVATFVTAFLLGAAVSGASVRSRRRRWY